MKVFKSKTLKPPPGVYDLIIISKNKLDSNKFGSEKFLIDLEICKRDDFTQLRRKIDKFNRKIKKQFNRETKILFLSKDFELVYNKYSVIDQIKNQLLNNRKFKNIKETDSTTDLKLTNEEPELDFMFFNHS